MDNTIVVFSTLGGGVILRYEMKGKARTRPHADNVAHLRLRCKNEIHLTPNEIRLYNCLEKTSNMKKNVTIG